MDRITHCKCGKRRVPVITLSGRTDLQCISCDDPVVKWAESPLRALRSQWLQNPLAAGQARGADAAHDPELLDSRPDRARGVGRALGPALFNSKGRARSRLRSPPADERKGKTAA
jgi:hypothetical protein